MLTINVLCKLHCTTDCRIRLEVLRGSLNPSISVRDAVNDNRMNGKAKIATERIKGRVSVGLLGAVEEVCVLRVLKKGSGAAVLAA